MSHWVPQGSRRWLWDVAQKGQCDMVLHAPVGSTSVLLQGSRRTVSPDYNHRGALGVCAQQFPSPLPLPSDGGNRWGGGIWDPRLARRSLYSQKDIKMEFMFLSLGDTPKGLAVLRSSSYHFLIFDWRTFLTWVSGLHLQHAANMDRWPTL